MGYHHVDGEVFYKGTTSGGYLECSGGEDKQCADQYGGSVFGDLLLAACCANDHLSYMQDAVSVATDGDSCTHVATSLAAKHALISTAAYCEPETLKNWDCGAPCSELGSTVTNVQTVEASFSSTNVSGVIRGFVGHWDNRCVLSLADPFSPEDSLAVLQNSTADDLEPFHTGDCLSCCQDCKVYSATKHMYEAIKKPLLEALNKIGCTADAPTTSGRRLMTTGHGFGAAVAALAAFDLINGTGYYEGNFGIEPSFSFGSPRLGNLAFANTFKRMLGHEIFRVTHHTDAVLQYPRNEHGFHHAEHELFFEGDASEDPSSYVRCTIDGENSNCAQRHKGLGSIDDHIKYMQPMISVDMHVSSCKKSAVV